MIWHYHCEGNVNEFKNIDPFCYNSKFLFFCKRNRFSPFPNYTKQSLSSAVHNGLRIASRVPPSFYHMLTYLYALFKIHNSLTDLA